MKLQWNILRRLSGNNRGSGIVVVLVSMTCIALMGASLLFMSYTAVQMRATERQASRDFYSAETAMDELRAGAQSIASDALGRAYKTVLLTYSEGGQMDQLFADAYVKELENSNLLTLSGTSYNLDILKAYVSTPPSGTLKVYSLDDDPDNPNDRPLAEKRNNIITLKNLCVEYTANNGYTTTINADISFGRPDFTYTFSGDRLSGLPEHALIVNGVLKQIAGNESVISITGSAYVGSMDLQKADCQLIINDGTLVCANDAVISGYTEEGRLVTTPNVKFWANRIEVKGGGTLNLDGETRVQDDLELAGSKSLVTLKGSYFGFGDGTTPNATDNPADYSSAILINGLDCMLDISNLKNLMLAGRSYISDSLYDSETISTAGVGMLESISVRSNQQMYLLDPADFVVDFDGAGSGAPGPVDQNPFITTADNLLDKENGSYKWIHLTDEAEQRATQYGYKLSARQYAFSGNQKVVYCFMEFESLNTANAYFEERFAKNSDQLDSYLVADSLTDPNGTLLDTQYSKLNQIGVGTSFSTYGYGLTGNGSATAPYDLSQPTRTQFYPGGMRATFDQMKKTLIDGNTSVASTTTPYTYIVDTEKISEMANTVTVQTGSGVMKEFYIGDDLVGVVVNGSYKLNGHADQAKLRLVLASGNVEVSHNYKGLIISGQDILLYDDVWIQQKDTEVLSAIKNASAEDGEALSSYFLRGITSEFETPGASSGSGGWNLDNLVTYKNWTKN